MKLYKLIANEEQLKIISNALESYARLGIGQLENVLFNLGFQEYDQFPNMKSLHDPDVESAISKIKQEIFNLSFKSSYSISNEHVSESFKTCYDLYQTIRKKIQDGCVNGSVKFSIDDSFKVSKNGIIQIELVEDQVDGTEGKKE